MRRLMFVPFGSKARVRCARNLKLGLALFSVGAFAGIFASLAFA